MVSVFATQRQQKLIEAYLAELRASIGRQVLIEAKILEVSLNDEFSSGINWRAMIGDFSSAARLGTTVVPPPFRTPLDATPNVVTLAFDNSDLDVIAHFIQRFGTVRTLSSPRLTVQQNQTAILKVAQNQVFFRLFFQTIDQDNGNTQTNVNSVIQTVPVGVIMTVQPSINQETDEISLALRPTVTRVVDQINDPAVAIASNNTVQSQVPVVAVQEIDSVVKLHSGQVAVMGGLMSDDSTNQEEGVPLLGEMPGDRLSVQGPRRCHAQIRARDLPACDDPRERRHRSGRASTSAIARSICASPRCLRCTAKTSCCACSTRHARSCPSISSASARRTSP